MPSRCLSGKVCLPVPSQELSTPDRGSNHADAIGDRIGAGAIVVSLTGESMRLLRSRPKEEGGAGDAHPGSRPPRERNGGSDDLVGNAGAVLPEIGCGGFRYLEF